MYEGGKSKMDDRKHTGMDNTRANRAAVLLTCLVVALTVLLATVTVIQFRWTKELQQQYDESRQELTRLQTSCLDDSSPEVSMDAIHNALRKSLELLERSGEPQRERRQAAGSLEQMLTEMMVAQEKVLMSHCLNSSKLCIPGQKGDPGMKGDPGLPGSIGLPGAIGNSGPKGDMGPRGEKGPKGDIGPQGARGTNGTQGPSGSQGLKGEPGPAGSKGLQGGQGPPGPGGDKGDKGQLGPRGPMGNNGTEGLKGEKGDRGLNGTKGDVGPQGQMGPPGPALQKDCACIRKPKIDVFSPNATSMTYPLGSAVDLTCGDSSNPETTITWSGPLGGCLPAIVTGGRVHIPSLQPVQVGTYTCTASNAFGTVSRTITINSNLTAALDCDFERRNTCLWSNSKSDSMDWTVLTGSTPTLNTGPSFDHTLNNKSGHYIYIETSSGQRGNFAELQSLSLGPTPGMCLSLWYNMHGSEEGSLDVLTKTCNSTAPASIRLHVAGNQGPDWHMAQIQLRAISEDYQIIIKAMRGSGNLGDIAIDDIKFYPGKCRSTITRTKDQDSPNQNITVYNNQSLELDCGITGIPPATYHWRKINGCNITTGLQKLDVEKHVTIGNSGVYECVATSGSQSMTTTFNVTVNVPGPDKCTFETGWCEWMQSSSDDFDWSRISGETPSKDTGPTVDHTLGSASGHYVFIEASSPRKPHDAAILRSHLMPARHDACVNMAYHMYGAETGTLQVFVKDACTGSERSLMTVSSDQGQQWHGKLLSIPSSFTPHDYYILVKAEIGSSYHSDIAIDDVEIREGTCP